ncbi:MAG: hypothetical protein ACRDQW_13865 [Haloechinothrix sp.]
MRSDRPVTDGVFWTLATLMTDCTVELSPREVYTLSPLDHVLAPGTHIGISMASRRPFSEVVMAAAHVADQGMRPVARIAARSVRDELVLDRMLGALANAGVRDLVVAGGSPNQLAGALDEVVRIVNTRRFRRRQFCSVGMGGYVDRQSPTVSAELLRASDAAYFTTFEHGVDMYLLTHPLFSVEPIIAWERYLRAAGNRLPLRVVLLGLASVRGLLKSGVSHGIESLMLALRNGKPVIHPAATSLRLAKAIDADPACLIERAYFRPLGHALGTARWINNVGNGNFYLEPDGQQGSQVTVLESPTRQRNVQRDHAKRNH